MINLLLQNNINISVLCGIGVNGKVSELLMVEYAGNQSISLYARQFKVCLINAMMKKITFGNNCGLFGRLSFLLINS